MTRLSPAELDDAIQVLDRRLVVARFNGATKIAHAIVTERNALVRKLGQTWRTETVA